VTYAPLALFSLVAAATAVVAFGGAIHGLFDRGVDSVPWDSP
jgi:hypothetical protein